MKLAVVSDLHIHAWREFSEPGIGNAPPTRLHACLSVLDRVRDYCVAHDIGSIVIGGDIFHKRAVVHTQPFNQLVERLADMKRTFNLSMFVVDGNHDHAIKSGDVHAVEALHSAGLVHGINTRWHFENWHLSSDDDSDELIVTGLSYCDNRETFSRRLDEAEQEYEKEYPGTPRLLVMHHGFENARVGSLLEHVVKEDIDPKVLLNYEHQFALSGHYHAAQKIGDLKHAEYIGSPMQFVRGEPTFDKGFVVYDTAKPKTITRVRLAYPQFVRLTQEQIDDKDYDEVDGNFVDVLYSGLSSTPTEFARELRRLGAAGVNMLPQKKTRAVSATRLDVDLATDPQTLLEKYVDHVKSPLPRGPLLAAGAALLERAAT